MSPDQILAPRDESETLGILVAVSNDAGAVIPVGGATMLAVGNAPSRYTVALDTRNLTGIVEYNPGDLTVVVRAGTPLADVQDVLREHGQFLALESPHPEVATVGGVLSSNTTGPLRAAYGSPRDLVIGTRIALPTGEVARSGGKVVKNVAGYDLSKLFIGAFGTLGVLVEAAFRVTPLPPVQLVVTLSTGTDSLALDAALEVGRMGAGVLCAAAVTGSIVTAMQLSGPTVVVVIAGSDRVTSELLERLSSHFVELDVRQESATDGTKILRYLCDLPGRATVRIWGPDFTAVRDTVLSQGIGAVFYPTLGSAFVVAPDWSAHDLAAMRASLRASGGSLVKLHGTRALEAEPTWDAPGPELSLMRHIKVVFDPRGIMSPGRFVGGL